MQTEGPLLCLQEPATCPSLEHNKGNWIVKILFLHKCFLTKLILNYECKYSHYI